MKDESQLGKIRINNMKFYTKNGVLPEERILGQQLEVDVELRLSLDQAGKTDDVNDTVLWCDHHAFTSKTY